MAKLEYDFSDSVKVIFEHSVDINGYSYLLILGRHINGGFICIPNHNIGCEYSLHEGSFGYNLEKLEKAGLSEEVARQIVEYIEGAI